MREAFFEDWPLIDIANLEKNVQIDSSGKDFEDMFAMWEQNLESGETENFSQSISEIVSEDIDLSNKHILEICFCKNIWPRLD